jgi:hypothetical protein
MRYVSRDGDAPQRNSNAAPSSVRSICRPRSRVRAEGTYAEPTIEPAPKRTRIRPASATFAEESEGQQPEGGPVLLLVRTNGPPNRRLAAPRRASLGPPRPESDSTERPTILVTSRPTLGTDEAAPMRRRIRHRQPPGSSSALRF